MLKAFTPVFLAREIREIEQAVLSQLSPPPLMARAGVAVAEFARDLLGDRDKRVLLLAGPGNNGGDAFVAARQLKEWWVDVTVVFTGMEAKLPADANAALADWRAAGGALHESIPPRGGWHRPRGRHLAGGARRRGSPGAPVLNLPGPGGAATPPDTGIRDQASPADQTNLMAAHPFQGACRRCDSDEETVTPILAAGRPGHPRRPMAGRQAQPRPAHLRRDRRHALHHLCRALRRHGGILPHAGRRGPGPR